MGVHSLPLPVTPQATTARLVRVFVRAALRWCILVVLSRLAGQATCLVVGLAQTRGGGHTTDSINKPGQGYRRAP